MPRPLCNLTHTHIYIHTRNTHTPCIIVKRVPYAAYLHIYICTHTHTDTHIRNTHVPFIMAHQLLCATVYMYLYICTYTHTKHLHMYETHTHHSSWRSACPVPRRRRARRWLPDVPSHSAGPPRWCSCGSPPWPSRGATPAVCVPAVDVQTPKYTPTQVYIHTKVNLVQLQQSALRACSRRPSSYVNRYIHQIYAPTHINLVQIWQSACLLSTSMLVLNTHGYKHTNQARSTPAVCRCAYVFVDEHNSSNHTYHRANPAAITEENIRRNCFICKFVWAIF